MTEYVNVQTNLHKDYIDAHEMVLGRNSELKRRHPKLRYMTWRMMEQDKLSTSVVFIINTQ